MSAPFQTSRRVEFRDTDAAGIMHFSTFFTAMEVAEHELLRSVGLSVLMRDEQGELSWPRVSCKCDYHRPLKFEDEMLIGVRISRIGTKSLTFDFDFTHGSHKIATGQIVCVCCRLSSDGLPVSIPIPEWIAHRLRPLAR